jgi:hypothetical protein
MASGRRSLRGNIQGLLDGVEFKQTAYAPIVNSMGLWSLFVECRRLGLQNLGRCLIESGW